VRNYWPGITKAIAAYNTTSECYIMHAAYHFQNAKNRPPVEICRVVYLLLLTAMTLVTSGEYATSIPHCVNYFSTLCAYLTT